MYNCIYCYYVSWVNYWSSIFRAFGLGKTAGGGQSSIVALTPQEDDNSADTSTNSEYSSAS